MELRDTLISIAKNLDGLIAVKGGCLHRDKEEISTMGNQSKRKFYCPDCGNTIEEEWPNVEDYIE